MKYRQQVSLLLMVALSSSALSQLPLRESGSMYVDLAPAKYWRGLQFLKALLSEGFFLKRKGWQGKRR